MTLEDQIYSLLCPEGADPGTCNWARKKAGEIVETVLVPLHRIVEAKMTYHGKDEYSVGYDQACDSIMFEIETLLGRWDKDDGSNSTKPSLLNDSPKRIDVEK